MDGSFPAALQQSPRSPCVVVNVLLELREVMVEGQMNDAVRLGRSVAQAVEVLDVAILHLGPQLLAEHQPRPLNVSAPAHDVCPN
jgi:hypothetical protein